jgi:hypothetical protein
MAIKYGFFNSVDGDRLYDAEDLSRYLHGIVSSGVYADRPDSFQVLANGNTTLTLQPGRAMLDGHYLESDEPLTFKLEDAGAKDRIDAVVLCLDMANRSCRIYIKTGTPSAKPEPPAREYNDTLKEWILATVYVRKLTVAITQSSVTDTRSDSSVCGWVTGLIDQVDTSTLFAQWEAAYKEQYDLAEANRQAMETAFNEWLAEVIGNPVVNALPVPQPTDAGKPVVVNPDGTGFTLSTGPSFEESQTYPGCYYRRVGEEVEWLNPPVVDNRVHRTIKRYNGGVVYVARKFFDEYNSADLFSENRMQIDVGAAIGEIVSVSGYYTVGGPTGEGHIAHTIPSRYMDLYYEGGSGGPVTLFVESAQTLRRLVLVIEFTKLNY